jgi:hypothetical protein
MNPVPLLVLVSLALVAFRFYQPWVARPPGTVVRTFRVPLMARVRLQRANVYAVAALMFLGGVGRWLPGAVQLLVAAAVVVLLLLPLRYTLTEGGIALGRTRLRRWSEFAEVERIGGRAVLTPSAGEVPMEVWLPGAPTDDAIEATLRRLVGGESAPAPTPDPSPYRGRGGTARGRRGTGRGVAKRAV